MRWWWTCMLPQWPGASRPQALRRWPRARPTGRPPANAEMVTASPSAASTEVPAWRRDAKTWLAEIARLRNAGDTARADAELAEYKRQQRAYAGAPDR